MLVLHNGLWTFVTKSMGHNSNLSVGEYTRLSVMIFIGCYLILIDERVGVSLAEFIRRRAAECSHSFE